MLIESVEGYEKSGARLLQKWKPIIEHSELPAIENRWKKISTAIILENTQKALKEAHSYGMGQGLLTEDPVPANAMSSGNIDTFDPVLISLVRRYAPNLLAYEMVGVQPMTGPTGLVFAWRPQYANATNSAIGEAWYNESNTAWSTVVTGANTWGNKHVGTLPGNNTVSANLAEVGLYNRGTAMSTAQAEALGSTGNTAWPQMSFTIDKHTVTARSRKLKAEYTIEVAQDLKNIHGMEIESELSSMLQTEIMSEINREIVGTVNFAAKPGSQEGTTTAGFFDLDTDSNGRWLEEKYKGLYAHIEFEANRIAKETRRGKGNVLICSSDVASALNMAGKLTYAPEMEKGNLQVDDTGVTFAGTMGRMRVFIDPYADGLPNFPNLHYMTIGFKGATPYEAGIIYSPYVPLQMVKAMEPGAFQPRIGFHTRYAISANPFAQGAGDTNQGQVLKDSNTYYRKTLIRNLR